MLGLDEKLDITATLGDDGAITALAVSSGRTVGAAKALAGRSPDEAATLLPLVFSLCGQAQKLAGTLALDAARGRTPVVETGAVRAETVFEHARAMLMDWAGLIGEEPDMEGLRALRSGEGGEAELSGRIFDMSPTAFLLMSDEPALRSWAGVGATPPARVLARAFEDGLEGLAAGDGGVLEDLDPAWLEARLVADDGTFVARPDRDGGHPETGPLARWRTHPLIDDVVRRHGAGLLARLTARLVDTAADRPPRAIAHAPRPGIGLGVVDAARGLLVHRVEMAGDRIGRYQILAPTEWNFHPDGPLARGLVGRKTAGVDDARRLVSWSVAGLDPCVVCDVTVEPGDQASSVNSG